MAPAGAGIHPALTGDVRPCVAVSLCLHGWGCRLVSGAKAEPSASSAKSLCGDRSLLTRDRVTERATWFVPRSCLCPRTDDLDLQPSLYARAQTASLIRSLSSPSYTERLPGVWPRSDTRVVCVPCSAPHRG